MKHQGKNSQVDQTLTNGHANIRLLIFYWTVDFSVNVVAILCAHKIINVTI